MSAVMNVTHDWITVFKTAATWGETRQDCSFWLGGFRSPLKESIFSVYFLFFPVFLSSPVYLSVIQTYLHSMNIIHRDLNSHNCLVREVRTCFLYTWVCVWTYLSSVICWGSSDTKQKRALLAVAVTNEAFLKTRCTQGTCSRNFRLTLLEQRQHCTCHMKTKFWDCRTHIRSVTLREIRSLELISNKA